MSKHLKTAKSFCQLFLILLWASSAWSQASTKARTFNGTSDYMQSAATINLTAGPVITLSFWFWFDDDDATQVWFETSADSGANDGAFLLYQDGTGVIKGRVRTSGLWTFHFTNPSAAAWHHYMVVLDNTNAAAGVATAYIDGSAVTVTDDTQLSNGGNYGNYTLNIMARNGGGSLHEDGRVSDIAIWTSGLTSGNATTLSSCANDPGDVGTVAFWWPIVQASPETASAGGVNLTVNGSSNSDSSCAAGGTTARPSNLLLLGVQ